MGRAWLMVASSALVVALGCGRESYERRIDATVKKMEYDRRVNKNLQPPPNEKRFSELAIYVRPPKDMVQAKAGALPVGEGQFDLDSTFIDKAGPEMHLLARVKLPKKAPAKGAPPPPPPPQRGEFNADVLGVLSGVFGASDDLAVSKFKDENHRANRYRRLSFKANDKEIEVYSQKQGNHEVALVFVYDPKVKAQLASKKDLCLETFAAGPKAARLYTGGAEAEEDSTAPAPL